jgi:hypothetical protein
MGRSGSFCIYGLVAVALILPTGFTAFAQKLDVKVIDRQEHETQYTYVVPGYSSSETTGGANCSVTSTGMVGNVNCNERSSTSGYSTPAHAVSFSVTGATFILLLPDGRATVVNCTSKFAEHFAGRAGNKRSCRIPLVDDIQAEFKGKDAKLFWVVSIDGKKMESETYTILAVLPKVTPPPAAGPASSTP